MAKNWNGGALKKLIIAIVLLIPALSYSLGTWKLFTNGTWYNTTTGQQMYLPVGTYPPGATTFTPTSTPTNTPTNTPTSTVTNTCTNTPTATVTNTPSNTPTVVIYPANAAVSFQAGSEVGVGPTFTPTNTFTPVPPAASQAVPNVVLTGKSLGTGTAVTPTPAISGGYITVIHTAHGYNVGDYLVLAGVTASPTPQYGLNALVRIATVTTNSYSIAVAGSGNIAGTMDEMFWFSGTRSLNPLLIYNIIHNGTGQYFLTFTNTQADAFYGIGSVWGIQSGNISLKAGSDGNNFSTTQFNVSFHNQIGTQEEASDYLRLELFGIQ